VSGVEWRVHARARGSISLAPQKVLSVKLVLQKGRIPNLFCLEWGIYVCACLGQRPLVWDTTFLFFPMQCWVFSSFGLKFGYFCWKFGYFCLKCGYFLLKFVWFDLKFDYFCLKFDFFCQSIALIFMLFSFCGFFYSYKFFMALSFGKFFYSYEFFYYGLFIWRIFFTLANFFTMAFSFGGFFYSSLTNFFYYSLFIWRIFFYLFTSAKFQIMRKIDTIKYLYY